MDTGTVMLILAGVGGVIWVIYKAIAHPEDKTGTHSDDRPASDDSGSSVSGGGDD
jgi:hypothetical protein